MKATLEEVERIVGEQHAASWYMMKPDVYYRHNEPYGLIATVWKDDWMFIASCAIGDQPFTKSMIRDIISLKDNYNIVLVTTGIINHDRIKNHLLKFNFNFAFTNEGMTMLSFHTKEVT